MHFFSWLSPFILLAKQALKTEDEGWEKQKPKSKKKTPPPPLFPLSWSLSQYILSGFSLI